MNWSTRHEMLYGEKHSAAAQADAWDRHVVFDKNYRCVSMRHEDGVYIAEDITEGMKMANGSGHDAAEGKLTVLAYCAVCGEEIVHGGDRAILRNRGEKEAAVYWCRECFMKDYKK